MKKTIRDYDLKGKKVLIRSDFNVPIKDGVIQDDTRIVASLKTIRYAINEGARVILFSHLGKVKTLEDKEANDLYPVSVRLGELLQKRVMFSRETRGQVLEKMILDMHDGDVLLVQNTRYEDLNGKLESGCDIDLSRYWAHFGDVFINDAYGTCHRAHASNVGIARELPNGIGFLVEEEMIKLDSIMNEDTHPFVVVMGGAKVHDKIAVIENLIEKCDRLLIGGGMAYTFLKAEGKEIGKSLLDEDSLDFCQKLLRNYSTKIVLPIDHVVFQDIESFDGCLKSIDETDDSDMGMDIGSKTIELFSSILKESSRVIMNGPMGYFEKEACSRGTKAIYDTLLTYDIKTLVGGGDSAAAVCKLSDADKFYHISTGGGATLEYLGGRVLPGISVIDEKEKV